MNQMDPEEPAHLVDQVCVACTQRECEPNQKIIEVHMNFSES